MIKTIDIDGMKIGGGGELLLIAGPCVIESEEIAFSTAEKLKELSDGMGIPIVYKSSYIKDNPYIKDNHISPGF